MTAAADGRLAIATQGMFDNDKGSFTDYKHCSGVSANLMPSIVISRTGCVTIIGWNYIKRCEYMTITCFYQDDSKQIDCLSLNRRFILDHENADVRYYFSRWLDGRGARVIDRKIFVKFII
jgi:hypothetical protein